MAYCRFGDASVYIYPDCNGLLACCGCSMKPARADWYYHSTADMVKHLQEHIAAGHFVPDYVIPALWEDDKENFPDVEEV